MSNWFIEQLSRIGFGAHAEELAVTAPPSSAISILLVDDTPVNLRLLMQTLMPLGHEILVATNGESALSIARSMRPSIILLDVMMPGLDGYEVCRRLKADPELAHIAVIFCSAVDDTAAKVNGFALGAVDFVTKPFDPEEVVARVSNHLTTQLLARSLTARNRSLARELAVAHAEKNDALRRVDWALIGNSVALRQLQAQIMSLATGHEPIVLRSDPDCGAEAVARAIHAASSRNDKPFIVVDGLRLAPGSNVTDLLPFTKKTSDASRFDLADGGTLFINHLDRIQASILDDLAVRIDEIVEARQAGRNPSPDTRIIAVTEETSATLPKQIAMSLRFLNVQQMHLPSLTTRREDIPALTEVLMRRQAKAWERTITGIDEDSLRRMQEHDWPGNLRELEDVVARAVVSAATDGKLRVDSTLLQSGRPLGSYRLLRRLGHGGFGEVWEARHHLLARPAAVKVILGSDDTDTDKVERFKREAAATARLASPHTVTLYDFGVSESGQFYYVMELLEGIDLETLYQQFGVLSPERLASFLVQACRSLAEAHHYGMIHRDIKPSNLFTCRLGVEVDVLKVLDFGLVRLQNDTTKIQLTHDNMLLGTPAFLAPEVALGNTSVEARSDIYSLAATAWTLATGKQLFTGRTPLEIIMKHIHVAPQSLQEVVPGIPQALADIIMAGLAKLPSERPTAQEMAKMLVASGLPQAWTDEMRHQWWQTHDVRALRSPKVTAASPKEMHVGAMI